MGNPQNANSSVSVLRPTVPPSEGERGAISGYSAQYGVAAALTLDALLADRLDWVRVLDPDAGRVDDFVIGTHGRVDCYQIKSPQYGGSITFRGITASTGDSPALLKQLAEGWQTFRNNYPNRRVVVHLVTNQHPSTNHPLPGTNSNDAPRHFAAFLEQVWKPARRSTADARFDVPQKWMAAWIDLRESSGLSENEFRSFIVDCELAFGYQLPDRGLTEDSESTRVRNREIDQLAYELQQLAADPQRPLQVTRSKLLERLGWGDRFRSVNSHRFPVDLERYQPIETTLQRLHGTLDELRGGYIAVIGSPGSGKSTLLTQWVREANARVAKYYVFTPDDTGPTTLRGESDNFFHDVSHQLNSLGFRVGESTPRMDHSQLVQRFQEQLWQLGQDWHDNCRKSVVLVDGLDHIEREQNPIRSLIEDLPHPEGIPDGVYIVLGTQYIELLPDHIQSSLASEPDRKVEIKSLSREQTHAMIGHADAVDQLTIEQRDKVFELSAGHPLATVYLIKQLQDCEDASQIEIVLEQAEPYQIDITRTKST